MSSFPADQPSWAGRWKGGKFQPKAGSKKGKAKEKDRDVGGARQTCRCRQVPERSRLNFGDNPFETEKKKEDG